MIVRKRCPYTGVVNFYSDSEPHMALGSIARMGRAPVSTSYAWRNYSDDAEDSSGSADEFAAAERSLLQRITRHDPAFVIAAAE